LYPIAYLAAKTGMRLSELLGLKWKDIDFNKKIIQVYSSSHYGKQEESEEKKGHHENSSKEGNPNLISR
jgi:integrase